MILTSNGGGQKKFDIKGSNPFSFPQTFSKLEFSSNYRDRSSQSKILTMKLQRSSIRISKHTRVLAISDLSYVVEIVLLVLYSLR